MGRAFVAGYPKVLSHPPTTLSIKMWTRVYNIKELYLIHAS